MKTFAEFQEFVSTSTHTGEILLCMKVPVTDGVAFKSAFEEVKETTRARDGCTQYDCWDDQTDSTIVWLVEGWKSIELLKGHLGRLEKNMPKFVSFIRAELSYVIMLK